MVADAIYVVPAARTDTYSWAPSLPSAGGYAVYAKWVADGGRVSDAVYGIYHAGGLAEVAQDQPRPTCASCTTTTLARPRS